MAASCDGGSDGATRLTMTGVDILLTVVLVVVLPGYMLSRSLAQRGAPPGDRSRRYRRTIAMAGVPLIAVAAVWLTAQRPAAALGLGAPDRLGAVLIVVAALAIGALMLTAPRVRRTSDPKRHAEAAAMMPIGVRETAWFLAFVAAVGIGWEILYRGYLWWVLTPAIGGIGAIAVMGVSYGVAHGYRSAGALAASIVSALLFAGGYALTGSLWWLIVIHVGLPLVSLRLRPDAA